MTSGAMVKALPWLEPLACLHGIAGDCALLYSGLPSAQHRYSYLAMHPQRSIRDQDFSEFSKLLTTGQPWWENVWIGYLGYELNHALETLPRSAPGHFALPALWMTQFRTLVRFDHAARQVEIYGEPVELRATPPAPPEISVTSLASNMTRAAYEEKVRHALTRIHAGDFYQANLTRKFFGECAQAPAASALFAELCRLSPAPYSAFLRIGENHLLSSSPECFLRMEANGHIHTRPIKGSAARAADPSRDAQLRDTLAASAKDRAENLMIVDLMRNDLARSCIPGSVKVDALCAVESYATIHHLVSTVSGQKRPDASALEVVKACFPPGSMTGAPKIRAMQWCTQMEAMTRGPYSGAIGWFGGDGAFDLSVTIRTLILQENHFEFQVGGGIVADSKPEAEWRETLTKARAIANLLGISQEQLENL